MDLKNLKELESYFAENFNSVCYSVLADLYLSRGDFKRAHKICQIGLEIRSDDVIGLFVQGRIYQAEGNLKEAEKIFKKVTLLDTDHYQAHLLLAEVQTKLHRSNQSLYKLYTRIVKMDNSNQEARNWLEKTPPLPKKVGRKKKLVLTNIQYLSKKIPDIKEEPQDATEKFHPEKESVEGSSALSDKDILSEISLEGERKIFLNLPEPENMSEAGEVSSAMDALHISPQIATFTLVAVLKAQKLYQRALEVLAVMEQKSGSDKSRIGEERKNLLQLIRQEGEK